MKDQFTTMRFAIEIAIALGLAVILFLAASFYNPTTREKKIKVDYFRIPTNNALVVLGLLVPILTALAAYLYANDPSGKYSLLLAGITLLFMVLIIALWETFALLGKAEAEDAIVVKWPDDRRYIVGLGLMYAFLLLALMYFALFFLFELSPTRTVAKQEADSYAGSSPLLKPRARISQQRDDLMKEWGEPVAQDLNGKTLTYQSEHSEIRLTFDDDGKLVEILEKRR